MLLSAWAQPAESPVTALDKINLQMDLLNNKYLAYMSEVAHGKKVKKAEKKHQAYMTQIDNAKYALSDIPYYKGDKSLHEGTKKYLNLINNIQKENFGKVVNMEEIAEQSYDAMEAYILFKKKINEKMDEAEAELSKVTEEYAARNNITLVEGPKTERGEKMKKVGEVNDYYDNIYLIFFKASIHDDQLVEAMDAGNLTAVEQIKGSLEKYALEGIGKLDTTKAYKGDGSLKNTCKRSMDFFKKEAGMLESFTDYLLKKEDFEAIKKNFERSAKAKNDKVEIDKYNKAVAEINKARDKYNQSLQTMNKLRADVYKDWNETVKRFMDTHIPYSK
jgi:hypothetical protein